MMKGLLLLGLLVIVMCKEDMWVKDERFDPMKKFKASRVVLYAPKTCILDQMPGVSDQDLTLIV